MSVCFQSGNQRFGRIRVLWVGSFRDLQTGEGSREESLLSLASQFAGLIFSDSSESIQIFHSISERQ